MVSDRVFTTAKAAARRSVAATDCADECRLTQIHTAHPSVAEHPGSLGDPHRVRVRPSGSVRSVATVSWPSRGFTRGNFLGVGVLTTARDGHLKDHSWGS